MVLRFAWLAAAMISMAFSSSALAQSSEPSPTFTLLEGDCTQLVVDKENLSNRCNDSATIINYGSDKLGMLFIAEREAAISFIGNSVPNENDDRVLEITHVKMKVSGFPFEEIAISGACTQIDMPTGRSTISCLASNSTRLFRADITFTVLPLEAERDEGTDTK